MYPNNFRSLRPLPIKAGRYITKSHLSARFIGPGKLPGLITITNTTANPDAPRVTEITVGAHGLSTSTVPEPKTPGEPGAGVYQTLESTTCSATDVSLSVLRAHAPPLKWSNNRDPIPVVSTPTRPKRSITVQRLGMQTPTPPWAIDHMLTRGGGRFSLMSLPEFHRPASKRLAVQYVEGESDVAATVGLKLVYRGTHRRETLGTDLTPERLKNFRHLVAERIRLRHLEPMDLLKLAIHNNLARLITSSSRSRHQVRSSSVTKTKSSQAIYRTRPILPPLDTDAARAYTSNDPTSDSPPESPGPTTPTDETVCASRTSKGSRVLKEKAVVPAKSSKTGVAHRVHSKGRGCEGSVDFM